MRSLEHLLIPNESVGVAPRKPVLLYRLLSMVDIHCHILPGIDDGAKSMEILREDGGNRHCRRHYARHRHATLERGVQIPSRIGTTAPK